MSIHIRIAPQPNSIGARRNRAMKRQQAQLKAQRAETARQWAMYQRSMWQQPFSPYSLRQPQGYGWNSSQMYSNPYSGYSGSVFGVLPFTTWNTPRQATLGWEGCAPAFSW